MRVGRGAAAAVTRKEDLRVRFAHHAGDGPDPRVEIVDERTGRLLVALPPEHAAMLGQALVTLATDAAEAVAQIEQADAR